MKREVVVFTCLFITSVVALLTWTGCTSDVKGLSRQIKMQQSASLASQCKPENFANFESIQAHEAFDLRQPLPSGVFLYTGAQWRVAKAGGKSEQGLIASESVNGTSFDSHVVCASRPSGPTSEFESSLTGVTKISSDGKGETAIQIRQFQAFMTNQDQGAVALNPRLSSQPMKTFADFLASAGPNTELMKLDERTFVLSVRRDSRSTQSELLIRFEFVPRG